MELINRGLFEAAVGVAAAADGVGEFEAGGAELRVASNFRGRPRPLLFSIGAGLNVLAGAGLEVTGELFLLEALVDLADDDVAGVRLLFLLLN